MTRQKTINQLKDLREHCKEISDCSNSDIWDKDVEALDFAIDSLNAGARRSRRGKWKKDGHGHVVCSVCGNVESRGWRFCSVCGAKMESEEK